MKKFFSTLALASVILSVPAFGVPRLRVTDITNGGSTVLIDLLDDQTSSTPGAPIGDTDNLTPGSISLTSPTTVGNWTLRLTGGTTKPFDGTAAKPILTLGGNIRLDSLGGSTSAIGRTLRIEFGEEGFTGNPFGGVLTTTTNPGVGASGGVRYGAGYGTTPGDALAGLDNLIPFFSNNFPTPCGSSCASSVPANPPLALNNYSLMIVSEVTLKAGARSVDFDATLSAVPEPGFYGMMALGLSGLFAAVARRRNTVKE